MTPITAIPSSAPSFIGLIVSIEISTTTSEFLSNAEVQELLDIVAQGYGVDSNELTSITEYVTSGTMVVDIPDTMSEDEAISLLIASISENLSVDEDLITISLDSENGDVTYSITTTDFETTANISEQLQDPANFISDSPVIVSEIISNDEIFAEVNIVLNADEILVPLQQAENLVDALLGDDYSSLTEVKYVTSPPSTTPTAIPSMAPLSSIPTLTPSITGSVVFIDMKKPVTASFTEKEIADLVKSAEKAFGLFPDNVKAEVRYDIMGTIAIETQEEVSNNDLIATLKYSVADSLNVHPSDVVIAMGSDSSLASYTISSDSVEEANNLQEILQEDSTNEAVFTLASNAIPAISMVSKFIILLRLLFPLRLLSTPNLV